MSDKRPFDGSLRMSVEIAGDGAQVRFDREDGTADVCPIENDDAIDLAASLFFAALCAPNANPDKVTAKFRRLVNEKGSAYRKARREWAKKAPS